MTEVPSLPSIYADTTRVAGLLADMIRSGTGAVALRDGKLIGFLAGWCLPSILGQPSAFSPEWANGIAGGDQRVTEALYTYLVPPLRTEGGASGSLILCDSDPDAFGSEEVEALAGGVMALGSLLPPDYDDCGG